MRHRKTLQYVTPPILVWACISTLIVCAAIVGWMIARVTS